MSSVHQESFDMKWFGRSPGYWLFWTGAIYFIISMAHLTWFKESVPQGIITLAWLILLSMPLFIPHLARYLNMAPVFGSSKKETEMSKEDNESTNNVLKFPEPPKLRAVEPDNDIDTSSSPYTIGVNGAGNVQLAVKNDYGTTIITMNDEGVITMIEDLAHYLRKTHSVEIVKK
jgi:hypothetical protein